MNSAAVQEKGWDRRGMLRNVKIQQIDITEVKALNRSVSTGHQRRPDLEAAMELNASQLPGDAAEQPL